jgi:hypothetical protein
MTQITRANVDQLIDARKIQVAMNNGRWWTIRRNGATKRWKRDAKRIYIPYKAGMYVYGAIRETDFLPGGELNSGAYRVEPA